jgi:hypothetical protein
MNGSTKIQPTHLKRQAVVYLRQSTLQQVLRDKSRLTDVAWLPVEADPPQPRRKR